MSPAKKKRAETDLYPPVHDFLVAQGFAVRSEVNDCDITATRDDDLVIVELKLGITIDLLAQAAKRQRMTDDVYVAVPRPKGGIYDKRFKGVTHLLRRLELGLLIVSFVGKMAMVEIAFHPEPYTKRTIKKEKRALLREIAGRSADYNEGGSTRKKLMTAYRENVIQVATFLLELGEMSPKQLSALGTGKKTGSILYKDFYGWFERIGTGIYALSAKGVQELEQYPELVGHYREQLAAKQAEAEAQTPRE